MTTKNTKNNANSEKPRWPGIVISDFDHATIEQLRAMKGPFQNIKQKDLLMIAASIALKQQLPADTGYVPKGSNQIIHPSATNGDDYSSYRQYISLIYFHTAGQKNLDVMNDTAAMMKNFLDYAHRGLVLLKANYLDDNTITNEELYSEFVDLLTSAKN